MDTLGQSLNQSITQLITSVTTMIGVLVMMLSISPRMTLIALLILPVSLVLVKDIELYSLCEHHLSAIRSLIFFGRL